MVKRKRKLEAFRRLLELRSMCSKRYKIPNDPYLPFAIDITSLINIERNVSYISTLLFDIARGISCTYITRTN